MALLLGEIEWGEPILPPVADPAWEAEMKRRGGRVSEVDRRVAPNAWMREACLAITTTGPFALPQRLFNIGVMVTAQENSCRYCYGANRAYMKILGYSESFISSIERDAQVAELDARERSFIAFCRNLARSRPRPAKAELEALGKLGFAPLAVREMAAVIAMCCFYNRLGILMASPPEHAFERMANGVLGRLIGMAAPLASALQAMKKGAPQETLDAAAASKGPFGAIVATLAGLPEAAIFRNALDGAFDSPVIARHTKALMFAVVARTLECRNSEAEARKLLAAENFDSAEVDSALATLGSRRLAAQDAMLLSWVRDTVYYRTGPIQGQTRALAAEIGQSAMLEAIGVAALANAVVRLAMLLE